MSDASTLSPSQTNVLMQGVSDNLPQLLSLLGPVMSITGPQLVGALAAGGAGIGGVVQAIINNPLMPPQARTFLSGLVGQALQATNLTAAQQKQLAAAGAKAKAKIDVALRTAEVARKRAAGEGGGEGGGSIVPKLLLLGAGAAGLFGLARYFIKKRKAA